MRVNHGKRFVNGNFYIYGMVGFLSFADERLMLYHGVNPNKFRLYLRESTFNTIIVITTFMRI